jgi:hypothetical protein
VGFSEAGFFRIPLNLLANGDGWRQQQGNMGDTQFFPYRKEGIYQLV